MAWPTTDRVMLDGWQVAADATRAKQGRADRPYVTELLGRSVHVWTERGQTVARTAEGEPLLVQDRYGHAWVCPSGRPARPLFAFAQAQEMGWRTVACGGIGVASSPGRVVENFLDMGHFPFVHEGILGAASAPEVPPYKLRSDSGSDELWAEECTFWQPTDFRGERHGRLVHYRYRAMLPCSSILYKSTVSAAEMESAIGLFVQPCAQERVIAYVLIALKASPLKDAEIIARQHHIFGQDKPILENHRPKRLPLSIGAEVPARCDAMSMAFRRWLQAHGCTFGIA